MNVGFHISEDGSEKVLEMLRVLKDKRKVVMKIFRALKLDKIRHQPQLVR